MSIRIYQIKDPSISVDQSIYATAIVDNYLDISRVKTSAKFCKTALSFYMIFTKAGESSSDEQVEKLTWEFNIHYRACIG